MRRFLPSLCLAVATLLAACGGGGGGDAPAQANVNVGGMLAGLGAGKSAVIADASGQSASLSANGRYSLNLPTGTAYSLRIQTQPGGQTCVVANGSGTATADVNNITVTCADNAVSPESRTVSGTVAGMGAGKSVVLLLNANGKLQEATVNADGSFQFPEPVAGDYLVTVKKPPTGQACTVDTTGTLTVTCAAATSSFKLGGTVSGNAGVVALRNTANGDTLALNTNGAFTFAQPVLAGGSYNVTVFDQSANQTCSAANGSGTANADVGNLQISCAAVVAIAPLPPVPGTPTGLTMTYGAKSFNLAWGTVTGAVSYRVFEDPDGPGPTAGAQIGGSVSGNTYAHVPSLLHTRLNARYTVQACNSGGCGTPTAAITPNASRAIGYFKASNTEAGDTFGSSVALSADGGTLAVGAYQEKSTAPGVNANQNNNSGTRVGAVYIYTRTGTGWSQQVYLKASNADNPGATGFFGFSVALSADGNTLAVGANRETSAATGINGNQQDNSAGLAGAVYVFTRSAGTWSQQAYVKANNARANSNFGYSVALAADGNTLAVGATLESSGASGINGNHADTSAPLAGSAYVFTRTGTAWSQQAYIKASNTRADSEFGSTVVLSADGGTLAVGAYAEDSNATGINGDQTDTSLNASGAVYVYTRTGTAWSQQAYLKASNTRTDAGFGFNLALSADGNTLAASSTRENSNAIGINGDQSNTSTFTAGAVYVFTRAAGAWSQQAYVKASNTRASAEFSSSLALSGDGNTLAVGAVGESSGATGIDGDQTSAAATGAGAVYLFTRTGGAWSQQIYLKAGNTSASARFGARLALSADGTALAVGSGGEGGPATGISIDPAIDNSAPGAGAVYLY